MYPVLKTSTGAISTVLNNTITAPIKRSLAGEWIAELNLAFDTRNSKIVKGTQVDMGGQLFDVANKQTIQKADGERSVLLKCKHVSYVGNKAAYALDSFAFTGTAQAILQQLITLTGAPFTIGTIDSTATQAFVVNEFSGFRRIVNLIADAFSLEVDYNNLEINLRTRVGEDNDGLFIVRSNLQGVDYYEDFDTDEVSLGVNSIDLAFTEEFARGEIKIPKSYSLGDTIRTVSDDVDLTTRITEVTYDYIKGAFPQFILSTNLDTYTSKYTNDKFSTVFKGRSTYGVNLDQEDGLVIGREDLLARVRLNADELRFQKGDGAGNWTDSLYFDIADQEYKFVGNVDVSGNITGATITASDIVGGTLNIGSGNFTSDSAGNVFMNSLTLGGGSGIANFSDAGGLATQDNITASQVTDGGALITKDGVDFLIPGEILNAGLLAVANYVDMSTSQVINKVADNIDETITRKWAAEAGADVTNNNIAAGFTGQGLVAVLDSISGTFIDNDAITTPKIATGQVVASKISVANLAAINANLGSITAGEITGVNYTVTDGTTEMRLRSGNSAISWHDSIGNLRSQINGGIAGLVLTAGTGNGFLQSGIWYYNDGSSDQEIATQGWAQNRFITDNGGWSGSRSVNGETWFFDNGQLVNII